MNIRNFSIRNLHGRWTFEVPIVDNTLVIVGENGSGKTTLVNLMYYFLSGQWSRLKDYEFDTISARFENQEIEVSRDLLKDYGRMERVSRRYHYPSRIQRGLSILKRNIQMGEMTREFDFIEEYCARYGIPIDLAIEYLGYDRDGDSRGIAQIEWRLKALKKIIGVQILYLPTYRRIEQELRIIFPHLDLEEFGLTRRRRERESDTSEYIELVEFGMNDVVEKIEQSMGNLKDFVREGLNNLTLRYLSEVIDADYEQVDLNLIRKAEESTINAVLDKIDPELLPEAEKQRLVKMIIQIRSGREVTTHTKIIAHFFLQLLYLQNEQQKRELHVRKFIEICNSYLHPTKELVYYNKEFQISIRLTEEVNGNKNKKKAYLKFKNLSSGEKQIVSLFSHLFLSKRKGFFVIIDEPELSLSVKWQENLLIDIKRSGLCTGLVAVTHSPFIYANELDDYAHGLNEYRR